MFERRLKILLLILVLATLALVARAFQIQGIDREAWRKKASETATTVEYAQTTRGMVRDRQGNILAEDLPSIDACVDYRAIPAEPAEDWLKQCAQSNLHARLGKDYSNVMSSKEGKHLLEQEIAAVRGRVVDMWATLAQVSGKSPDEIEEIRRSIEQKVRMRQSEAEWRAGHIVHREEDAPSWYESLLDEDLTQGTSSGKTGIMLPEEMQPHVIVTGLTASQQVELSHDLEKYPALSLQPGKHRYYPFGVSACHIVGQLGLVGAPDMLANKDAYGPSDMVGRSGIEALCEKALRGSRGRIEKIAGTDEIMSSVDAVPGRDVKLSVDIGLEAEIETAFVKERKYLIPEPNGEKREDIRSNQHGAAVIIKVDTGEVLAMVSNPGFDPNTLGATLHVLVMDDLNLPLLNRATEMSVEPGSSVKPIVASGAITDGVMNEGSTVQCRGILVINGHEEPFGHCWVFATAREHGIATPTHSAVTGGDLPNDMLTIADGLERSCNVVFETTAYRMGMHSLSDWFTRFGLGRPTGIGLHESSGRLYRPTVDNDRSGLLVCAAGIGEQVVQATPIQMANVAATIARRGVWMRPQLVSPGDIGRATTQPAPELGPDRVDLHLSSEALHAVQEGMRNVVNGTYGSGHGIRSQDQQPPDDEDLLRGITIAGKTGTAQTSQLTHPRRDADHRIMLDENKHVIFDKVDANTPEIKNWYKMSDNHYQHAWFIGYAPADHPQVAFCVMVEYGEAGGRVAGSIAHDALVACVRHGYLVRDGAEAAPEPLDIH